MKILEKIYLKKLLGGIMNKKDVIDAFELKDSTIQEISTGRVNADIRIKNLKKLLSFISDIVLKSDYSKIINIYDQYGEFKTDFKKIILVGNKEKVLGKLLNNTRKNNMILTVEVYFRKKNIDITYKILFDEKITSPYAYYLRKVHKVEQNKIFSEYNNNINGELGASETLLDITEEYLNNIYKVAENFRDKFTNINISEQCFIDFINCSFTTQYYKKQIKELISGHDINCATFTDMIFRYNGNKILLEFIKMLFEREYSAVFGFGVIDSHIIGKYNSLKSQNVVLDNILSFAKGL